MTKQETVQLLAYLSAFWPNWNVTKATVEAWHEMLADLDHGVALMALKRVVARVAHFPTIAEIRQEAAAVLRP
ncbi:MAG: hypothetical protein H5U01_10585, partial [Clostridia bacterium]|nr:hypothetical protein [Clostridia bacterium]